MVHFGPGMWDTGVPCGPQEEVKTLLANINKPTQQELVDELFKQT